MEKVILQSPELVREDFIYRDGFYFQRLTSTMKWYVTYKNQIIAQGMYRNDLIEWIDITYPKKLKEVNQEEKFRNWLRTNYGVQDYNAYANTQTEEIAIRFAEYSNTQTFIPPDSL